MDGKEGAGPEVSIVGTGPEAHKTRPEALKFAFGPEDVFSRGERPHYFKGYHRIMAAWKWLGERRV